MIYLKLFEELSIDDLDSISKKYSKSNYLSSSSIKKMEEIGIGLNDLKKVKEKVRKAYMIDEIIKDSDNELIDELFVSLDDILDKYNVGFKRSKLNTNLRMTMKTPLFSSSSSKDNTYIPLEGEDIDVLCIKAIKTLLLNKEEIFKDKREKQKASEDYWTKRNYLNRDFGSLSSWKNKSIFEGLSVNFEISFQLKLHMPSQIADFDYYDSQNTERPEMVRLLNNITYSVSEELREIFKKLLYLNDIDISSINVKSDYSGYYNFDKYYTVYFTL